MHHRYSPSKLGRAYLCPGSIRMSDLAPDQPDSEDAQLGTKLHKAVATRDLGGLSDEDSELVEACFGYLERATPVDADAFFEQKLSLLDAGGGEILFGTADVVLVSSERVMVIDWKFGYQDLHPVMASFQLSAYAAMAWQLFGKPVQAMAYHARTKTEHQLPSLVGSEEADEIRSQIESMIATAEEGVLTLSPHPAACEYCPAMATCPAVRLLAVATAKTPENGLSGLSVGSLGKLGKQAKLVTKQAELVLDEIKARFKAGELVPGWKWVLRQTYALLEDRSTAE